MKKSLCLINEGMEPKTSDPDVLIQHMQFLLDRPTEARRMGDNARQSALSRFGIDRFVRDWNKAFYELIENKKSPDRIRAFE